MDTFYYLSIYRDKKEALIESLVEYDHLALKRGEFIPEEPFKMKLSEGSIFYDIVGFQDTSNFAISERLYNLLIENEITGWRAYKLDIKGTNERYYGFQVTGRCSKLIVPKDPGFYIGLDFEYNSWDKSDFFSPDETAVLLCTERVKDILIMNKLTNIEIKEISEKKTYSVGRKFEENSAEQFSYKQLKSATDILNDIADEVGAEIQFSDESAPLVFATSYVINNSKLQLEVKITKAAASSSLNKHIGGSFSIPHSSKPFTMILDKGLFSFFSKKIKFKYTGDKKEEVVKFFKLELSNHYFTDIKQLTITGDGTNINLQFKTSSLESLSSILAVLLTTVQRL